MRFSFIVPLYKGQKYVDGLVKNIEANAKMLMASHAASRVELIFVNDLPNDVIDYPRSDLLDIRLLEHPVNMGIHQARVTGLGEAMGDYITFLDQDDDLRENFLISQFEAIGDADIVVCNAYIEDGYDRGHKLYEDDKAFSKVKDIATYIYSHNQIVSPGQCLIKREAIPDEWSDDILDKNGSDDLLLWILMAFKGAEIVINDELLYTHRFSGANLSLDADKMADSSLSFAETLEDKPYIPASIVKGFVRSRRFDLARRGQGAGKAWAYIKYFDIVFRRILWKIIY